MKIYSAAIRYKKSIYYGKSHAEIGIGMINNSICKEPYPSGDDQGFMTECGKYVRREPALIIAIKAGQVEAGKTLHDSKLFSEDLNK